MAKPNWFDKKMSSTGLPSSLLSHFEKRYQWQTDFQTVTDCFRLYLLTWNVGGAKAPQNLEGVLSLTTFPLPDMYGIG